MGFVLCAYLSMGLVSSISLRVQGDTDELRDFIEQRIRQAFNADVVAFNAVAKENSDPAKLRIDIQIMAAHQLRIVIEQGTEVLASRTIEGQDFVARRVMTWLFLKQSLGRLLPQSKSDSIPVVQRIDVAAVTQPTASEAKDTKANPEPKNLGQTSVGALATMWLETPKLFAMGMTAMGRVRWEHWVISMQAGYRYTQGPPGLTVHAMPIVLAFGIETGNRMQVSIGAQTSGELKFPIRNGRGTMALGADIGPYAQARFLFSNSLMAWVFRLGIGWRLLRQQYSYVGTHGDNNLTTEHGWVSTVGIGWMWQ